MAPMYVRNLSNVKKNKALTRDVPFYIQLYSITYNITLIYMCHGGLNAHTTTCVSEISRQ